MTRVEENKMVIEEMTEMAECNPVKTYEDIASFQLSVIATVLADISKSLAILAEPWEESEDKE